MTRALDATRAAGTDKTGLAHPTTRRTLLWRGLVAVPAGAAVLASGADLATAYATARAQAVALGAEQAAFPIKSSITQDEKLFQTSSGTVFPPYAHPRVV